MIYHLTVWHGGELVLQQVCPRLARAQLCAMRALRGLHPHAHPAYAVIRWQEPGRPEHVRRTATLRPGVPWRRLQWEHRADVAVPG